MTTFLDGTCGSRLPLGAARRSYDATRAPQEGPRQKRQDGWRYILHLFSTMLLDRLLLVEAGKGAVHALVEAVVLDNGNVFL